jgi:hypothetical protein
MQRRSRAPLDEAQSFGDGETICRSVGFHRARTLISPLREVIFERALLESFKYQRTYFLLPRRVTL